MFPVERGVSNAIDFCKAWQADKTLEEGEEMCNSR